MRKFVCRSLGLIGAAAMCAANLHEEYYVWAAFWLLMVLAMVYQQTTNNKSKIS